MKLRTNYIINKSLGQYTYVHISSSVISSSSFEQYKE